MANKIYVTPETAIVFKESGGDVTFTPKNVADGAGRISNQWDRGAGAKPARYYWRAVTKAAAALALNNWLEIYLVSSDGTSVDGNFGTTDAAVSSIAKLNNLQPVGAINVDSTSNGEPQIASGVVEIFTRYVSVVWWNEFGQTLTNVAGDHSFSLTPVPDEIQ